MTDTELLRRVIRNSGLKYGYIAEKLGLSRAGLLLKVENKTEFKQSEIAQLSKILQLSQQLKEDIFYSKV